MDFGLVDRVAAVTGAGRGIGAATACTLAREGAAVVVADRDGDAAQATARDIVDCGGRAIAVACDVTREDDVQRLVTRARDAYGGVHVLVNNAGVARDASLLKMAEADWDLVIDITLKGAFHCCRAVLPLMRQARWGRVVNIASRSIFGNPGQTNYAAAKAGLVGFTRALALEQARHGITVNALAPGFIETDGIRSLPGYDALRESALAKTPVGFLGQPDDVAAAVAFLASGPARYITGTTLFITGGRYSS